MSAHSADGQGQRINKFLASCGVGSRRGCEHIVREGRVTLNGRTITDLATRVNEGDHVKFDGKLLQAPREITVVLHKPAGYVSTRDDPQRRRTVYELLPAKFRALHHVGRLDYQSSGLLLFTNSGDFTERLTHPRHHVEKEYRVVLDRAFDIALVPEFLEGIPITEGVARAVAIHCDTRKQLRVVLAQGYNRQIRRMFSRHGYKVRSLERIRIGTYTAPDLGPCEHRVLDGKEIKAAGINPA